MPEPACTCRVTVAESPMNDTVRFDKACPYHGDNGSMVAVVRLQRNGGPDA